MHAWTIGLIVMACVFGGALAGLWLRSALSGEHLSDETKDVVKVVSGLIATLSALVLGLLIASAKSSFDGVNDGFAQIAAKVVLLDHALAQYGPAARPAREQLRRAYAASVDRILAVQGGAGAERVLREAAPMAQLESALRTLEPGDATQRALKQRAEQLLNDIAQIRWLGIERSAEATPTAFLVVLVSWLAAMFLSFGLFSPSTPTALVALAIGAVAVSTAIFLIEEMGRPLEGMIAVSAEPLRAALPTLDR